MSFVYNTAPNLRLYPVKDVLEGPYLMEHYDEALIRALRRRAAPGQPAARSQRPEGRRRQDRTVVPGAVRRPEARNQSRRRHRPRSSVSRCRPERISADQPETRDAAGIGTEARRFDARTGAVVGTRHELRHAARHDVPQARRCRADSARRPTRPTRTSTPASFSMRSIRSRIRREVAGLSYDIDVQSNGFLISVAGYDDKQPLLLGRILDVFANIAPSQEKVADYREELRRSWQNFVAGRPYEQALASSVAGDDRRRLAAGTVVRRAGRRDAGTSRGVATRPPESLWRTAADARQRQFGGSRARGAHRHLDAACRRGRRVVEYRRANCRPVTSPIR